MVVKDNRMKMVFKSAKWYSGFCHFLE